MQRQKRHISALWRDSDGVAFLEFALIFPLLLMLFLGGVEISRYVQAAQKADKMTHTVVDLVAQAPTVSVGDLNQIMHAVEHIMNPYDFSSDGVIIISCVGYNQNGQLRVKWQYRGGGTLGRSSRIGNQGFPPSLPDDFTIGTRDNVIIAETFFRFSPMLSASIAEPTEFYRTAFYLPRLGELDTLRP